MSSVRLRNGISALGVSSKLVMDESESKSTAFVFSVANVFVVEAINGPRTVALFGAKEASTECVKGGSPAPSGSPVRFPNSHLRVNQRNGEYRFLCHSLDWQGTRLGISGT